MDVVQTILDNGYVYIEGVGLDDPNQSLETFVSAFARPIAYLDLPLVMDLRPKPGYQPASFAGTGEFNMHTDLTWHEKPAKYIAMFCVARESAGGGIPLLADGWQAFEALDAADQAYLKTEPVTFPTPSHIDYPNLSGPIVTEPAGKYVIRFRYDMLENPTPPVTRYFEAINDHIIKMDHVQPGSIFAFDNERMLHGRTALQGGMQSDRHFKRMYGDV